MHKLVSMVNIINIGLIKSPLFVHVLQYMKIDPFPDKMFPKVCNGIVCCCILKLHLATAFNLTLNIPGHL